MPDHQYTNVFVTEVNPKCRGKSLVIFVILFLNFTILMISQFLCCLYQKCLPRVKSCNDPLDHAEDRFCSRGLSEKM